MKNCAKLITTIIVLIFITFLIILSANLLCIKPNNEYTNYYEQIGINNIILSNKNPYRECVMDGYLYKYYDDICLVFYESGGFMRAEITGNKYKLDNRISIGSQRNLVESFYSEKRKIKDLDENQFGFIEEYIWIHFYFDSNDTVQKILIYSGI